MKTGDLIASVGACACTFVRVDSKNPQPIFKADSTREYGIAICPYPGAYENVTIVDVQGKVVPENELYNYHFQLEEGCFRIDLPERMQTTKQ